MPRIGSNVVDEAGVRLLHNWIAKLPGTGLVGDAPVEGIALPRAAPATPRNHGEMVAINCHGIW